MSKATFKKNSIWLCIGEVATQAGITTQALLKCAPMLPPEGCAGK